MDIWQFSLAIGAIVALVLSYRVPRAALWIASLVVCFTVTMAYAKAGLPYRPVFNALCDTIICLLIDRFAREKFEVLLFNLMRFSVLVSVIEFSSNVIFKVENQLIYAITLEGINWTAYALIGGMGIHQWMSRDDRDAISRRPNPALYSLGGYLRSARKTHSWLNR